MNKKIIFILLVIVTTTHCFGQEKSKRNSIKFNASDLIFGLYELKYERAIGSNHSIEFSIGTGLLRKNDKSAERKFENEFQTDFFDERDNEYRLEVFQTVTAAYRYYLGENELLSGFYVSPGVQFYQLRERYSSNNNTIINGSIYILFNFNGKIGYQLNWGKTFQMNPHIGFSQSIRSADPYITRDVSIDRFGADSNFIYGIDIGFRF